MNGFLVAAPASGSGKTTVTLGLLRALRDRGIAVAPAKAGPDYIDPAFHAAACGAPCMNLDPWAMRPALLGAIAMRMAASGAMLVVEGMMGLFDGAADGTGSAADLAGLLGLPVVLVVDCAKQSQSVAALVRGFRDHRADVRVAGVILNRIGSARHEAMIRRALEPLGMTVLGCLPRDEALRLPERHLGLVQAGEHGDIEGFIAHAAAVVGARVDFEALLKIGESDALPTPLCPAGHLPHKGGDRPSPRQPLISPPVGEMSGRTEGGAEGCFRVPNLNPSTLPPLGQRVAVARDEAFAFAYPHILDGWRTMGAELTFFSPLAGEAPDADADAIYLPGGYPELHAGRLAAAQVFRRGVIEAAARGATVYGECGGYMVLGNGLIDAAGERHAMLGLLPLETSFAQRRLHLGYRRLEPLGRSPWPAALAAHEFHYARIVSESGADRLFRARDALDEDLGPAGLRAGSVSGSFMHVIDLAEVRR